MEESWVTHCAQKRPGALMNHEIQVNACSSAGFILGYSLQPK
jgi:hypothetical protein